MNTYIDIIRKACIATDPSILDLKFGCEVKMLLGDWYGEIGHVEYPCSKCPKHKLYKNCTEDCDPDDAVSVVTNPDEEPKEWIFINNGKDFEILGRPIRLADVLLAIAKCKKNWNSEEWGVCDIQLSDFVPDFVGMDSNEKGGCAWNLLQDNLTLQSEPTLEFLAKLLS